MISVDDSLQSASTFFRYSISTAYGSEEKKHCELFPFRFSLSLHYKLLYKLLLIVCKFILHKWIKDTMPSVILWYREGEKIPP